MSAPGLLRPPDWTRDASCQGLAGPDLDPFDDQSPFLSVGRRICADCPVRHPCALYALREGIPHGLWGGLDPTDRRRIARKHGYPNPGAAQHGDYSRYVTCTDDNGRPCADCREAKRRYIAARVAREGDAKIRRGRRHTPGPSLALVLGHGKRRAYPGQFVLFTDGLPSSALLRPADTTGRTVAA